MRDDAKSGEAAEGNKVQMMSIEEHLNGAAGTPTLSTLQTLFANGRAPLIWGVLWGIVQAAAPLGLWWLDAATVYGMSIALIATAYMGFASPTVARPSSPSRPPSPASSWCSPRQASPVRRG